VFGFGIGIDDNGCAHDEQAKLAFDVGRRDVHLEAPTLHPDILHPRPFERPLVVAGRDHEHGEPGRADGLAEVFHSNRGSSSSLPPKA